MRLPAWLHYFARPFPPAVGFSAYRMPGMLVHLPVLALFLVLGARMTLWDPWLMTLLPVYLLAGLYLGRDIAIHAHYNPLVTLAVLAASAGALAAPGQVARALPTHNHALSLAVTAAVAALVCAWVRWQLRRPH